MGDQPETSDVIVLGGGVIGAAVAWRSAQRGLRVTLVDPQTDAGAWRAAAGMLAPLSELHYCETGLLRLSLESLERFPGFVSELTELTGVATGFRRCGTVTVGWDGADLAGLRDVQAFAQQLGLDASMVTGRELRSLEPALATGLPGGLLAENDHQVDPRLLHQALLAAGALEGVVQVRGTAEVVARGGRAAGVRLSDGTQLGAGTVVAAMGAWTGGVGGVPRDLLPAVRPVKGQTLRLRLPGAPRLSRVVRGVVRGSAVYLVPRADGRLVVGASSEEAGYDASIRAGAVYESLRDAQTLLPELGEAVLEEVAVGFRPGTPDNLPIVGPSGLDGLLLASGHYRNGILLSAITADGVADVLSGGSLPDVLEPCAPGRLRQVASA
ncbi:glycine oxidase ThiO [Aeromicrobium sp.]|uniref:glycine oxidase ThiO n=1 Tax=Aeromicrobium sp. TaxID=1871063 RepID=UPI002FCB48D5